MSRRKLTKEEEAALLKIGNRVFDLLTDAGLSDQRADRLAMKADSAIRRALEDGE